MANTRMFAIALQSKDNKEVHVFKHTIPNDYDTTSPWDKKHREIFIQSIQKRTNIELKNIEDFQIDTFKISDKRFYTEYFKEYLKSIGNINYAT